MTDPWSSIVHVGGSAIRQALGQVVHDRCGTGRYLGRLPTAWTRRNPCVGPRRIGDFSTQAPFDGVRPAQILVSSFSASFFSTASASSFVSFMSPYVMLTSIPPS